MQRAPVPVVTALLLSFALVPPALARHARPALHSPVPVAVASPAPIAAPQGAPAATTPILLPAALPSLSAAEELMISRSDAGLVPFTLPGGGVRLDLQGRFQDFAAVSFGTNGKLVFRCLEDATSLRQFLAAPAVPTPAPAEDR